LELPGFKSTETLMNETTIVTVYGVIDDVLKLAQHQSHRLSQLSDAEVLTVAVSAALHFRNHQERTFYVLERMGYLSGHLSISRFNRRLHKLRDWLEMVLLVLSEVLAEQSVYIIDSLPLPVCHGRALDAAARCVARTTVAIVPPKTRSSSVGACT
jgi:UDP-N-acetylmuramyl pentapeptide phosphotransferase/UDP-N-acetylglucosamine-1-phosphate transferase